MEQLWEILKEYLGEAIIFIAMILRTARSGTSEEKQKKLKEKMQKKCKKDLERLQVDTRKLEEMDGVKNGSDNG